MRDLQIFTFKHFKKKVNSIAVFVSQIFIFHSEPQISIMMYKSPILYNVYVNEKNKNKMFW